MRKLLVAHLAGERGVSAAAAAAAGTTSAAAPLAAALRKLGIKVSESLRTRNLLKLAPETRDLSSELDLELGIGRLVLGKMLFRLIEGDESVLDAAREFGLRRWWRSSTRKRAEKKRKNKKQPRRALSTP